MTSTQLRTFAKLYATEFARMGGRSKSARKAAACRRNGKLGGRPRKLTTDLPGSVRKPNGA